jgi:hypothetical protein
LNGDGRPDLAVADNGWNMISVLPGNGDGGFGPKTDFETGWGPWCVAIGDLNGDRTPDLVTPNLLSSTVSVLLGHGDGSFGIGTEYGTGTDPISVAIGDLNHDGKLDLVTADNGSRTVSVLLGNGDGSFGVNTRCSVDGNPCCVAIGDLNRDGKPDLVGGFVLLGNGDGTFVKTNYWDNPRSVATGDMNGDGKLDVVAAYPDAWYSHNDRVGVMFGDGNGSFASGTNFTLGPVGTVSLAIGDLNGDGKLDVAVADSAANTVSVLLGNGNGGFSEGLDFGTGFCPYSVAIGDLNGDGRPDLAVANYLSNTVSVLLNTGGSLPTPVNLALVDAHATAGRVVLRWYGASAGMTATVYRRTAPTSWAPIANIAGDGSGILRFEDVSVQPGARYGYRLGIPQGGAETFYGETWVDVPALAFALDGLRPNPAVGEVVASFTLPSGSPARLQLLDVTGRVWLARDVGDLGSGTHSVRLGGPVPAGMYWLRLTQGGHSLLARGVVMR